MKPWRSIPSETLVVLLILFAPAALAQQELPEPVLHNNDATPTDAIPAPLEEKSIMAVQSSPAASSQPDTKTKQSPNTPAPSPTQPSPAKDKTVAPQSKPTQQPSRAVSKDQDSRPDSDLEQGQLRFYSSAPSGEIGLVRVMEAYAGQPMTIRLSLHAGLSTSNEFLKYGTVPRDYSQSNFSGRLAIAFTPVRYFEAFLSLRSSSNKNNSSTPNLLQSQGDLELGAKGSYALSDSLWLGLNAAVVFSNGIGDITPDFQATNVRTSMLLSFDSRPLLPSIPFRTHLNAGMIFENTSSLTGQRDLTWIEQYALNIATYHRVFLGIGIDAPLSYLKPFGILPFLEFSAEMPLGVSQDDYSESSLGPSAGLINIMPLRLTPGLRMTFQSAVTLDLACDIALGGEKAYIDGVPAMEPWRVWLGLTYAFDPTRHYAKHEQALLSGRVQNLSDASPIAGASLSFADKRVLPVASDQTQGRYVAYFPKGQKLRVTCSKEGFFSQTKEVEVSVGEVTRLDFTLGPKPQQAPKPSTGRIVGRVINKLNQQPIGSTIISFPDSGLTPVATDSLEGKYTSYQIKPGSYQVLASKQGYRPQSQTVQVDADQTAILDFSLESKAKQGTLSGTVLNEKAQPMIAQISIDGPQQLQLTTAADTGVFAVQVPVGTYQIKAQAAGYLSKARQHKLKANETMVAEYKLSPKPKKMIVILRADKKKIAVNKKIYFASGKTKLRPESHQLIDGVIHILVNHPEIKRLRIEGHTDSVGAASFNLRLSQGRAQAVRDYMIEQGMSPDRIEAKGFGETKPIAPNSTRRGKEQNRRVEFTIVEP